MPRIYQNMLQTFLRITFFDKFKNYFMPYDVSKYEGMDYMWRVLCSSALCAGMTFGLTYPLDVIHTRTCGDMSKKGATRLYKTTFDCFNRTNIDEGKLGLYKGMEYALISVIVRSIFTLPIYSLFKDTNKLPEGASWSQKFYKQVGAACVSSTLLSLIAYPIDTAKRSA